TSQYRALAGGPNASKFLAFPGVAPNGGPFVEKTCADVGLIDAPPVTANSPVANCAEITGQGLDIGSPLTSGVGHVDPAHNGCYHLSRTNCTPGEHGPRGNGNG